MQTVKMIYRSIGALGLLFSVVLLHAQSSWRGVSQVDILATNLAPSYSVFIQRIDGGDEMHSAAQWNYGGWLGLEKEIGKRWSFGLLFGYHQDGFKEKSTFSSLGNSRTTKQKWKIHQLSAPVYICKQFGKRKLQYHTRASLRPGLQLSTSGDLDGLFLTPRKGLLSADLEAGLTLPLSEEQSLRMGWVIFGTSLLPFDERNRQRFVYTGFRLNYVWGARAGS